ncbi:MULTISPECIES: outer membrane protein assembly factor BamE domain-containing protein [Serratia]|nr:MULTISPECIES: outer membrane protein assembly factor BamE [Serratia]MDI9110329.1 outer membrane protein assembly factor BamE [Serratia marcescens]MDR8536432.1 outer membrane protein assembly factor BamE [Serratia nevei]
MVITRLKILTLSSAVILTGCTNYEKDGFPKTTDSYLTQVLKYEPELVKHVTVGTNKDAVRATLGNPQFNEFMSNDWNYVLDIHNPGTDSYHRCQLRITFKDDLASRLAWKGANCPAPKQKQQALVSVEVFFAFSLSEINDIMPSSKQRLDSVINDIKTHGTVINNIRLIGNADTVGQTNTNYTLGLARARTIQKYLSQQLPLTPHKFTISSESDLDAYQQRCVAKIDGNPPCSQHYRRVDVQFTVEKPVL